MIRLLVILIALLPICANAQSVNLFLSSDKITVYENGPITGTYKKMPYEIIGKAPNTKPKPFTIIPKGDHWSTPSPKCTNEALRDVIQIDHRSNKHLADSIQSWSNQCNEEINHFGLIEALTGFLFVRYRFEENPEVMEVDFTLRNGDILNGVIGVKDRDTPRPLIISKCGLYCDTGNGSTSKNTFMHLYDETPFNLLVLSSSTGSKFAKKNNTSPAGGFVEGEQIIQVIKLLLSDNSKFKHVITDIHLHGFSLGSNATLMAALYASFDKSLPVRSAVASCPVINLKNQMKSIFSNSLPGIVGRLQTLDQLNYVYDDLPQIQRRLPREEYGEWTQDQLYYALSETILDYYKHETLREPWPLEPFKGVVVDTKDKLWHVNEFKNYIQHINIPTTIVYASDDFFVTAQHNAHPLKKALKENPNDNIGIVDIKDGNHCAFSFGVGWDTYSTLMKSLYSKYSTDFEAFNGRSRFTSIAGGRWSPKSTQKLKKSEVIVKSTWEIKKNRDYASLYLTVFDKSKYKKNPRKIKVFKCERLSPFNGYKHCYKEYKKRVSLDRLRALNIKRASNDFFANRMTRWLNTNTHLTSSTFKSIEGQTGLPFNIHYTDVYEFNN